MKKIKEDNSKSNNNLRSWMKSHVRPKPFVMSLLVASSVVGGTMITQGFDAGVEKKEEIITTIQPTYNYFEVSLDNEQKDGLLIEAETEIQLQKEFEEKRLKAEAEAKEKAIAEAKAQAEAEARAKAKAQAEAEAKAKEQHRLKIEAEERAKAKAKAEQQAKMNTKVKLAKSSNSQQIYANSSNVPLSQDIQAYLNQKVQARGLDLAEVLAVMKVESSFNPNANSGSNFGYFQINAVNHQTLSQKLGTANDPLDPYINIDWGTYMLSDLYKKYSQKGFVGQELREVVLSAYNKGEGGYQRTGKAYSYINKVNSAQNEINNWLN